MPARKIAVHLAMAALSLCVALRMGAQSKTSAAPAERIEARVVDLSLGGNEPPLRLGLQRLMQLYQVPGLSVAVIDGFRIVWTGAYGVVEVGSARPVTPGTLFQAGSISKPVAAAGALRLVEQGRLSLDEDVNSRLQTWKVPENEFTRTEKVTLRRLMSHTAGLTVGGFPGYETGAHIPTLAQILDGTKPANTPAVRVDLVPGTRVRYSGGGVTVEQLLMMDVTGKPFPALMRELVLDRIGMTGSGYEQPLPPARAAVAASGADTGGKTIPGRWHVYPEMAAAGLWTTPTDLANFAVEIALSRHGKSNRILSEKITALMLTPVLGEAGLGFFLDPDSPGEFGHNGADEGFQSLLWMNSETGKGVAIMANSDNGNAVGDLLLRAVAREYGWNYKDPEQGAFGALMVVAKTRGTAAALRLYTEFQKPGDGTYRVAEWTLDRMGHRLLDSGQNEDAIGVFRRNVREYPKSARACDSLGDAYAKTGQKDLAIHSYEMSLQLDPNDQRATDRIRDLKGIK